MGLKCFKTGISNVANSETLRLDTKFREFYDVHKNSLYNSVDTIFLNEVLSEIKVSKFKKGELSEVYHLLNISDQKPKCVTLTGVELVDEIGSDKNPLWDADIIISKLGLSRGYVFLNEKDKYPKLIGSTELIPYKVINKKFHPKFLKYFFFIKEVAKRLEGLGTGKTPSHKRVNPSDILNAKIPNLSRGVQIDIIKKIDQIEAEVQLLQTQIQQPLPIINDVFADVYGYVKTLWRTFGKGMTAGTQKSEERSFKFYKVNLNDVPNSAILRFSSRFHSPITRQLEQILHQKPWFCIKNILQEHIRRGVQPKIEEEGEVNAAKTGQLKNGYFDFVDCDKVSFNYFKKNEKAQVKQGDVLIASTGKVSLGKIDFVDFDENALADGHISIIRIDENKYNPLFLTYFLRSILGTYQIERDYTGTTNQIELYANEIANFQIPNLLLEEQEKIVSQIKNQLDAQKVIEQAIEEKQNSISDLILGAIDTFSD